MQREIKGPNDAAFRMSILHDILCGMPLLDIPCLLLAEEICFLLRISDTTRRKLADKKLLVPRKVEGSLRYLPLDVWNYINSI